MEAAVKGNHGGAAGGATHDFQGVFGSFGTAVGQHAADGVTHRDKSAEALHQFDVGRVRRGVECVMGELGGLLANGLDHGRVAMAEVEHADAADKVDVALAVGVPDFGVAPVAQADGMDDGDRLADGFVAHGSRARKGAVCAYLSRARGGPANEIKSPGHSQKSGCGPLRKNCRSRLAGDRASEHCGSFLAAIAGKPAPTVRCIQPSMPKTPLPWGFPRHARRGR